MDILLTTRRPVVGGRAVQQLDEAGGDLSSAVPAFVNDQAILQDLAVELTEQVVLAVDPGVGDIEVTEAATARPLRA